MVQEIRCQLWDFLKQSHKTQKQVAKEAGLSTAVISRFLAGNYEGNNEEVAEKLQQYLTVSKQRLNRIATPEFCPTLRNTEQVLFAASYAHKNNDIAIVYGAAGAGKTTALKYYAENNANVIFVTANACCKSPRDILYLISEVVGIIPAGRQFMMMRNLVAELKDSNRLLIIDEADHLTINALQAVRNLNDEAGIGIVLSGNDRIKHQMYGRGSLQFDQLRTRVVPKKKVSNTYTMEEMQMLFPGLDSDCIKYLLKLACSESLRTAIKRYVFSAQCAHSQNQQLTIHFLRESEVIQLEAV